jgi:sorbitol/mannitol transport system permease protein
MSSTSTATAQPPQSSPSSPPPDSSARRAGQDRPGHGWRRRAPLLPALIFVIAVTQIPFLLTVFYSFQSWNLVRPGSQHFVGFQNYVDVFADSQFRGALLNTVLLTVVCVFVAMGLGLGLALLLDRKFLGRGVVRTLIITPFLILPAAGALIWKTTMFDPVNGLLNFVVGGNTAWLTQFPLAAVMTQIVWQWTPFMMLLILAGLQAQSKEVLEAAQVDGAGRWRTFVSITLPQLSRYLQLAALLGAIYIVNSFDAIFLMTQGGPGTASTNLPYYIYQRAFQGFDIGQSSAMGVIVVILTLVVATFALRLMFRTFSVNEGVK